jgi:UDP-glucose 4-epimerase
MKVLVTGGAGYIGSVVAAELLAGRHDVVVYDNLVKGHVAAVPSGARFVQGDLKDADLLQRTCKESGIEAVVHMAAYSLVGESVQNPAKYYDNNVVAGLVLLDAMRACDVKSIVFSSTAAVYGEPAKQAIEETDPHRPTNPYGQTKLAFEEALGWYHRAWGLRAASLRYFNAAGATEELGEDHDPETHLIPLVLQVAQGRLAEATIFGDDYDTPDGTCIRDYIHVVDLAKAHVLALSALHEGRLAHAHFNLGCGGDGYSVKQVIDVARDVTGHAIPVRVGARRAGDPARLVASSARIRAELGWRPAQQDLKDIVASAWRWMQRRAG